MRNLQTDTCGPGGDRKRQATSRPDHSWPELWTKFGRNAKLRVKQKWSIEKPKLEEDYEESISLTLRTRNSNKPLGMSQKIGNTNGFLHALQGMQEK